MKTKSTAVRVVEQLIAGVSASAGAGDSGNFDDYLEVAGLSPSDYVNATFITTCDSDCLENIASVSRELGVSVEGLDKLDQDGEPEAELTVHGQASDVNSFLCRIYNVSSAEEFEDYVLPVLSGADADKE